MAHFVSRSEVKSIVWTLTTEISTLAAFAEVMDGILTTNPFACTHDEVAGVLHDGTEKARESETARFAYENMEVETIGTTRSSARRLPHSTAS